MARKQKADAATAPLYDVKTTTAPCVRAIRAKVDRWRADGYPGASDTTCRLHAVAEARDDFARSFLLVAPNVIVFERPRTDFAGRRVFELDPVIPEDLRIYWDLHWERVPMKPVSLGCFDPSVAVLVAGLL